MWADDDPDAEAFERLYWLQSVGADVEVDLEALRARRQAEVGSFEALTGVGWQAAPPVPTVVRFPTEAEREDAYERAPIYSLDGRTGEMTQLRARLR